MPDLQFQGTIDAAGGSEQSTTILNLPSGEKRLYIGVDDAILIHDALSGAFIGRFDTVSPIENVVADDFYQLIYTLDEKTRLHFVTSRWQVSFPTLLSAWCCGSVSGPRG